MRSLVFKRLWQSAHAFLFCFVPIVFLYSQNIEELRANSVVRPLLFSAVLILIILAILRFFIKDFGKLTVVVTISIILFFSYGFLKQQCADVLSLFVEGRFAVQKYDGSIALFLILLSWFCLSYLTITKNVPTAIHDFLNLMAATTLAISLFMIGFESLNNPASRQPTLVELEVPLAPADSAERSALPDIIYIIPDRYPNNYVLRRYFGFDNQKFLGGLKNRGFFISEKAHANYLRTGHSLAATLNLQHITNLSEIYGEDTGRWQPVFDLLQDHMVQRLLRARGYRYVHLGSWWEPTALNIYADANVRGREEWLSRFEQVLLEATPVQAIWNKFKGRRGSRNVAECERVKKKIEFLKHVGGNEYPVFVFAHFLVPHGPNKFDAEGSCIEGPSIRGGREMWEPHKQGFVEQLKFMNSAILDIFDYQEQNNPNNFVFVVQSDEGPYPMEYLLQGHNEFDWETASADDIMMKFGILNALYLYDKKYDGLHAYTSPVNNFRIVFNNIFGTSLPLLEDRAYIFKNESHIFKFTDVTDRVRRLTED